MLYECESAKKEFELNGCWVEVVVVVFGIRSLSKAPAAPGDAGGARFYGKVYSKMDVR